MLKPRSLAMCVFPHMVCSVQVLTFSNEFMFLSGGKFFDLNLDGIKYLSASFAFFLFAVNKRCWKHMSRKISYQKNVFFSHPDVQRRRLSAIRRWCFLIACDYETWHNLRVTFIHLEKAQTFLRKLFSIQKLGCFIHFKDYQITFWLSRLRYRCVWKGHWSMRL